MSIARCNFNTWFTVLQLVIYIFFCNFLSRNTVVTSECTKSNFNLYDKLFNNLEVECHTTSENVLSKSIPTFCANPFATNLALHLTRFSSSNFRSKSHLLGTIVPYSGMSTNIQAPLSSNDCNSSSIAFI